MYLLLGTPGTLVSAVPEPETYAMLLAGLAVVGFVVRRKYKQNSPDGLNRGPVLTV
ncbi:MAG: PEP-CTERM sorting domain-containing protein [Pedobacter sp.]|nr:MAG: PEP-CTERM sorting domain-containing protein [Pedobacter sp.]